MGGVIQLTYLEQINSCWRYVFLCLRFRCVVCILTYMARRNVYINQANEKRLQKITDPSPNLSGLINNLLAEWFEKAGLK